MAGLCKATIIGNLGGDPEMRYTQAGKPMTRFRVACNSRRRGQDGEMVEETEWLRVTCFSRLAEVANEYLTKGSRVFIEGRLRSETWDGQDGQKRFSMEILANELQILDSRSRSESPGPAPAATRPAPQETDIEDLPF